MNCDSVGVLRIRGETRSKSHRQTSTVGECASVEGRADGLVDRLFWARPKTQSRRSWSLVAPSSTAAEFPPRRKFPTHNASCQDAGEGGRRRRRLNNRAAILQSK